MAYVAHFLGNRLRIYAPQREIQGVGYHRSPVGHYNKYGGDRDMAWCKLDLCRFRFVPWVVIHPFSSYWIVCQKERINSQQVWFAYWKRFHKDGWDLFTSRFRFDYFQCSQRSASRSIYRGFA